MNRVVLSLAAGAGALGIAACSNAVAGTTAPKASPSSSPGRGVRLNGAAGQLVQIKGQTLIISNSQGDTTVSYTSSTPIRETSTAALADITAGECIVATGSKDAAGQITAQQVNVRNASNGSCAGGAGFGAGVGGGGGGGGFGNSTRTPSPNRTPNPQLANLGRANGLVTAVNGTSVTVQDQGGAGTTVTVTVPTTVTVNRTDTVDSSALQTGECVLAAGSKNSAGVVAASSLTIQPAGPNGCFSGAGAGGGFFGGGGRGFPGGSTAT